MSIYSILIYLSCSANAKILVTTGFLRMNQVVERRAKRFGAASCPLMLWTPLIVIFCLSRSLFSALLFPRPVGAGKLSTVVHPALTLTFNDYGGNTTTWVMLPEIVMLYNLAMIKISLSTVATDLASLAPSPTFALTLTATTPTAAVPIGSYRWILLQERLHPYGLSMSWTISYASTLIHSPSVCQSSDASTLKSISGSYSLSPM